MRHPLFTPAGVEAMTQMAREAIAVVELHIARLERMAMLIDTEERDVIGERLSLTLGGEDGPRPDADEVLDDVLEAIWLLVDNEQNRVRNLRVALDEGELVVSAQATVNRLAALIEGNDQFEIAATAREAMETINALNEARVKGAKG